MKKKTGSIIIILFLIILFSVSFYLVKKNDLGTKHIESEIGRILEEKLGCCFSSAMISGNPFTGYYAEEVNVTADNEQFIKAERIELKPDLLSLLKGKIVIAELAISGSTTDLDVFGSVLKKLTIDSDPGGSLIEKVTVTDSRLTSTRGILELDRGFIITSHPSEKMELEIEGSANDQNLSAEGNMSISDDHFFLNDLNVFAEGTALTLSGKFNDQVILDGHFQTDDAKILSSLFPGTGGLSFQGGLASSVCIRGKWPDLEVKGSIEPDQLMVAGFLFNNGRSHWSFSEGNLSFYDMSIISFGSPIRGGMSFRFNEMGIPAELILEGTDLNIAEWTEVLPWLDFADGTISEMSVNLEGPIKQLSGKLSLSSYNNLTFDKYVLEKCSAEVGVEKGRSYSFKGEGLWHGSVVKGEGRIRTGSKGGSEMSFSAENLNLASLSDQYSIFDKLKLQGNLTGNIDITNSQNSKNIKGTLRSEKIRLGEELLGKINLDFSWFNDKTIINSLKGTWKGVKFTASGDLSDIDSNDPRANLLITTSSLGEITPVDLKNSEISGMFSGGTFHVSSFKSSYAEGSVRLSGQVDLGGPDTGAIRMEGSIYDINAGVLAQDLDINIPLRGYINGKVSIKGSLEKPETELKLMSDELLSDPLSVKNVNASLKIRDKILFIKGFKATTGESPIRVSGNIHLDENREDQFDVHAVIGSISLSSAANAADLEIPVEGTASADIRIGGNKKDPQFILQGSSDKVTIKDLTMDDVFLDVTKEDSEKSLARYVLRLGSEKEPLEVTGDIRKLRGDKDLTFLVQGTDIDLSELFKKTKNGTLFDIKGKADYHIKGSLKGKNLEGEAEVLSSELSLGDVTLEDISIPLDFDSTSIRTKEGRASFYKGNMSFSGAIDWNTGKWESSIKINDADIKKLTGELNDAITITGRGSLELDLSGLVGKVYLMNGNGALSLRDGVISGLEGLERMGKTQEIKYRSLNGIFNIDGRNIFLMPGSRLTASVEDPNLRYLAASGALGSRKDTMNLQCSGVLNVQALGAILGAMKGLVSEGVSGEAFLQNFLSGIVGGYTGYDFRDVKFDLCGTWKSPELLDLEVVDNGDLTFIPSDGKNGIVQDEEQVKFEVKFPTGEGEDNSSSAGDQFKKQFMDNILKQIFEEEDKNGENP